MFIVATDNVKVAFQVGKMKYICGEVKELIIMVILAYEILVEIACGISTE